MIKKKNETIKKVGIVVAMITVFYVAGYILTQFTELEYRMWAEVLGQIWVFLVVPAFVIIITFLKANEILSKKMQIHFVAKIVVICVGALVAIAGGLYLFLLIIFTTDEETKLTNQLLAVNKAGFLGANDLQLYEPVALVFRRPGSLTDERKKEYLEEKYQQSFTIETNRKGNKVVSTKYPNIAIQVVLQGMQLRDNYMVQVDSYLLKKGYHELGLKRGYYISEDDEGNTETFYLELYGEEDISDFSKDVAALMKYAYQQDIIYEKQRGELQFFYGEVQTERVGFLPFGHQEYWGEPEEAYFQDSEKVKDVVSIKFADMLERIRLHEIEKAMDEETKGENSNEQQEEAQAEVGEEPQTEWEEPLEIYARKIYESYYEEMGYSYEISYNAKGNFYINMGRIGSNGYTLVYDRESKNGQCYLFVAYEEHYDENNQKIDNTSILNFYAVEKETCKVAAADKTAWAEVGSKEYRDISGE